MRNAQVIRKLRVSIWSDGLTVATGALSKCVRLIGPAPPAIPPPLPRQPNLFDSSLSFGVCSQRSFRTQGELHECASFAISGALSLSTMRNGIFPPSSEVCCSREAEALITFPKSLQGQLSWVSARWVRARVEGSPVMNIIIDVFFAPVSPI